MDKPRLVITPEGLKFYSTKNRYFRETGESYSQWLDCYKLGDKEIAEKKLRDAVKNDELWAIMLYLSLYHPDYDVDISDEVH